MNGIIKIASVLTLISMVAVAASSQVVSAVKPGTVSLSVADSVLTSKTGYTLDLTRVLNVKGDLRVSKNMTFGVSTNLDLRNNGFKNGPTDFTVNYYLPALDNAKETVPYFGAGVGLVRVGNVDINHLSDTHAIFQYGGQVGIQHFLSKSYAVFGEVNYRVVSGNDIADGDTALYVGVTTFLN